MPKGRLILWAMLAAFAMATPAQAASVPAGFPSALRESARECERRGEWEHACSIYLRLIAEDGQSPELRQALVRCGRRAEQVRRLADPVYRQFAESLSLPQALAVYNEVLTRLRQLYCDADKATIDRLYRQGLNELSYALPDAVFSSGRDSFAQMVRLANATPLFDLVEAREAVKELALAGKRLTGANVGLIVLECAAGACAGLDEYTLYLHPGRDDELAALGLTLIRKDQELFIDRVQADSWAALAGLLVGDRIQRLAGDDAEEVEVQSPGEPPRFVRLPAVPPAVAEAEPVRDMTMPDGMMVGYIRIANFGKQLPIELDSALLRLRSAGVRGLVIDLRGVPGGSFQAAVQAVERFLPRGAIVTARGQQTETNRTYTATGTAICDLPLVLLIDVGTASAAEVLAAAFKEHDRAVLVGQTTYGKAAVQQIIPLDAGGGVRLTLARLFGPGGKSFHGIGISPHIIEPVADRQLDVAFEQVGKMIGQK